MASLTVRGTIDSLEPIREFVTTAAAEAGLDRKRTYRLMLAIDELATNIATYGYADAGRTGNIDLTATIDDERLTLVVEDTAIPFDPRGAGHTGFDRQAAGREAHRRAWGLSHRQRRR